MHYPGCSRAFGERGYGTSGDEMRLYPHRRFFDNGYIRNNKREHVQNLCPYDIHNCKYVYNYP